MAKFPKPPSAEKLRTLTPELYVLPRRTELWRLYFRGGRHPTLWDSFRAYGPMKAARFDHHLSPPHLQQRSILYAAKHGPTCLAEVFQETRVIARRVHAPWLAGFALAEDLQLLDLTGTWATRAGASMVIGSGPRSRARLWSQAFHQAYPEAQGLLYSSSMHANQPSVALYERAIPAIPRAPIFHRPLDDPALLSLLKRVALDIGYGLI